MIVAVSCHQHGASAASTTIWLASRPRGDRAFAKRRRDGRGWQKTSSTTRTWGGILVGAPTGYLAWVVCGRHSVGGHIWTHAFIPHHNRDRGAGITSAPVSSTRPAGAQAPPHSHLALHPFYRTGGRGRRPRGSVWAACTGASGPFCIPSAHRRIGRPVDRGGARRRSDGVGSGGGNGGRSITPASIVPPHPSTPA